MIIKLKANNIVTHSAKSLDLRSKADGGLIYNGSRNPLISTETAEIIDIDAPDIFKSNWYTYTEEDGWQLTPCGEAGIAEYLEQKKTEKTAELANVRYEKETGGIVINGADVKTDRESQSMITGAYNLIQIDPTRIIDWKASNGWIQLDAPAITAIATAVSEHVQTCFRREKEISTLIEAAETIDDLNAIDLESGWPE
jgi:hypothetical protein